MATYADGLKHGYKDRDEQVMQILENAELTDAKKLDLLWWMCADADLRDARRRDMVKS